MDRFRARGHDITVLTTTMRIPGVVDPPDERARGILRDLTFYWRDHELISPPVWERARIERANHRALETAIQRAQPDVVSVWNMGGMSLGLLTAIEERDIPMVLAVCDEWLVYGPRLDAWTRLFAHRPLTRRAASVLAGVPTELPRFEDAAFCFVSDFIRRRSDDGSWHPKRTTVVYSGIDEREFPVEQPSPKPWRWRILVAGRLDERKGVHVAVRALAQLPAEATLTIVGRGDDAYRARLDQEIASLRLGDRVRFGAVERPALKQKYEGADAVLFPVLWEEPFGLVPVEAMACGTPVIATATGGSAEFLLDGINCLVVPPGDERALADAIKRLADDAGLRAELARGGSRTARILTIEKLADAFETWHRAAAEHFSDGEPGHRPTPTDA
jgi:glycosyltransferase involved in cell wall biosynthesis